MRHPGGVTAGRLSSREAGMVREGYLTNRIGSHIVFFRSVDEVRGDIETIRILHERMEPFRHIP